MPVPLQFPTVFPTLILQLVLVVFLLSLSQEMLVLLHLVDYLKVLLKFIPSIKAQVINIIRFSKKNKKP